MAQSYNKIVLMGRLAKDPVMRTAGKAEVCGFSLAVDKGFNREGAFFFDCQAWGKTGEYVSKYLKKGSLVLIDGNLEQQVWKKDNETISRIVVNANTVQGLSSKNENNGEDRKLTENEVLASFGGQKAVSDFTTTDIPF